ncbi:unnamed protein product [Cylicocyclus nassatus]|uniref:acid phosphatase n=1 Tax=Cylicocyclus nassatus TaxID=53992 RepID=A0AA36GGU1_CYLNA|nr:unnamed protein product [Cylicocyclus nassatus]
MTAVFLLFFTSSVVARSEQHSDMKLELVQLVWRHGDRSPTHTHKTDTIREDDWKFGGGGWGQLSTIGMRQHFEFGKQLRKRYVDTGFLSKTYNAKEIYVRSTDYNRTIVSAMSNLMGMYSYHNRDSRVNVDFPEAEGWPHRLTPIPVHTVDHHTDFVGIAHARCNRKEWLGEMMRKRSREFKALYKDPMVKKVFKKVSKKAGGKYDDKNVWEIYDVWLIEQVHFLERLKNECDWYSIQMMEEINAINKKLINYDNGVFGRKIKMNGLDMGREIKKLRGGSLANDMNMHMHLKHKCLNRSNESECRWISGLKYYAYSAHDTTVFALLAALGIQSKVVYKGGYPEYTAAAFVELYTNKTDNKPYFKLLYRTSSEEDVIHTVTHYIPECGKRDYCELEVFQMYAEMVKPDKNMIEWCEVDPRRKRMDQRDERLKALIEQLIKELNSYSRRE